jgi:hypothetical protein
MTPGANFLSTASNEESFQGGPVVFTPFRPSSVGVTARTGPAGVTLTVAAAGFAASWLAPNAVVSRQPHAASSAVSARRFGFRIDLSLAGLSI